MRRLASLTVAVLLTGCSATGVERAAPSGDSTLGIETSTPSAKLRSELDLPFDVRVQGRVVDAVAPDGPAEAAGLQPGDVLLTLGGGALYSADDVRDFERVHRPEDVALATVRRRGASEDLHARIVLGATTRAPGGERPGALDWQFSNMAGLADALDRARAERKRLLVGLSGAET